MNYLFIVQGEGRGHMTQAVSLQNLLEKNGHRVVGVLVGKSPRRVVPPFFYDKINCQVETYDSPNFVTDKKGKGIRIFATIWQNMLEGGKYLQSIRFIKNRIHELKPDAVINFYELLGGLYFFRYRPAIRHICIGHQFLVYHKDFEYPRGHRSDLFLFRFNTTLSSLRANQRLALSFRKMSDIPAKKVYVVPPLLRKEVLEAQTTNGNYILSYILNDGYREEIIAWQKKNPENTVHFFSDGRQDIEQEEVQKNLFWHRIDDQNFLQHMKDCQAFATTAGFESVCEAMYMRKPVMMVPTGGHFEQACNALDAVKSGAGIANSHFDLSPLIKHIPDYQTHDNTFKTWVDSAEQCFLKHLAE